MHLFRFFSLSSAIVLTSSMLPLAAAQCEPTLSSNDCNQDLVLCGSCGNPPVGAVRRAQWFAYKVHRLLTDRYSSGASQLMVNPGSGCLWISGAEDLYLERQLPSVLRGSNAPLIFKPGCLYVPRFRSNASLLQTTEPNVFRFPNEALSFLLVDDCTAERCK